jgi:hypothetical protein
VPNGVLKRVKAGEDPKMARLNGKMMINKLICVSVSILMPGV